MLEGEEEEMSVNSEKQNVNELSLTLLRTSRKTRRNTSIMFEPSSCVTLGPKIEIHFSHYSLLSHLFLLSPSVFFCEMG